STPHYSSENGALVFKQERAKGDRENQPEVLGPITREHLPGNEVHLQLLSPPVCAGSTGMTAELKKFDIRLLHATPRPPQDRLPLPAPLPPATSDALRVYFPVRTPLRRPLSRNLA